MSFFYIMDDLRFLFFFFSFFFFMVRVVCLARDGCLVRSLVGVTQCGLRCRRPASEAGCAELLQKQPQHNPAIARFGGSLAMK